MRSAPFERERSETLILSPRKSLRTAANSWATPPKFSRWKAQPSKPSAPDPIYSYNPPWPCKNSIPHFRIAEVPSLPHLFRCPFSLLSVDGRSCDIPQHQLDYPSFPCITRALNISMGGVAWTTGVYGLCCATIPRQETGLTFAFQRMENCGIAYLIHKAT